ncbi:MAG: hypothetical protein IKA57_01045 [Clostridia bacterium]|nr:hypothetical protein [Clostridia bacterium]
MSKRTHSFIWSGIIAAILFIVAIVTKDFAIYCPLAVLGFTLTSCLILNNNFIGEMILEICSWGFIKMPGLIFTLDLDGIIWLLTVKLLFWILGILLAILCATLAIGLGLILSLFVYPFALSKDIRGIE